MLHSLRQWYAAHRYCLWLLYFVFYLTAFFTLEHVIQEWTLIVCPLDDLIPYCEWFVFLYGLWFIFFPGALAYFLFGGHGRDFANLCLLMFSGMTISLLIYVIWPNGLDLRVADTGADLAGQLVAALQGFDSAGNVCPSIHCSSSAAVAVAVQKSDALRGRTGVQIACWLVAGGICLSTLFIKQHSIVDVVCGVGLTFLLTVPVYHTRWQAALAKTPLRALVDF